MNDLRIENVVNSNTVDGEYVLIKIIRNTNLNLYGIVDKTFDSNGKETDTFRHFYPFPNQNVLQDEFVVLHSSKGTNTITPADPKKNFAKTYHYFWGSKSCIWNDNGDTANLIRYSVIQSIEVPPVKP